MLVAGRGAYCTAVIPDGWRWIVDGCETFRDLALRRVSLLPLREDHKD